MTNGHRIVVSQNAGQQPTRAAGRLPPAVGCPTNSQGAHPGWDLDPDRTTGRVRAGAQGRFVVEPKTLHTVAPGAGISRHEWQPTPAPQGAASQSFSTASPGVHGVSRPERGPWAVTVAVQPVRPHRPGGLRLEILRGNGWT